MILIMTMIFLAGMIKRKNQAISICISIICLTLFGNNFLTAGTAFGQDFSGGSEILIDENIIEIYQESDETRLKVIENIWFNNSGDDYFDGGLEIWTASGSSINKLTQVLGESEIDLDYNVIGNAVSFEPYFGMLPYGTTGTNQINVIGTSHDYDDSTTAITTTYIGEKPGRFGLVISTTNTEPHVLINDSIKLLLELENTGNVQDVFSLSINEPSGTWSVELSNDTVRIDPYNKRTIEMIISPGQNISVGDKTSIKIKASSETDRNIFDEISITATAEKESLADLLISQVNFSKDSINASVVNEGSSGAGSNMISLRINNESIENRSIPFLSKSESTVILFNWTFRNNTLVEILIDPDNSIEESDETNNKYSVNTSTVQLSPPGRASIITDSNFTGPSARIDLNKGNDRIEIRIKSNESVIDLGWEIIYSMEIINYGNNPDTIILSHSTLPEGWTVIFLDENNMQVTSVTLGGAETVNVGFLVRVPWNKAHVYLDYTIDTGGQSKDGEFNINFEKRFLYPTASLILDVFLSEGSKMAPLKNMEVVFTGKFNLNDGRTVDLHSYSGNNFEKEDSILISISSKSAEDDGKLDVMKIMTVIIVFILLIALISVIIIRRSRLKSAGVKDRRTEKGGSKKTNDEKTDNPSFHMRKKGKLQ